MAISALTIPMFISCDNKTDSATTPDTDPPTEVKTEATAPASLDVTQILSYSSKKTKDYTSADYDFMLNQMEILANKATSMSKKEWDSYLSKSTKEEREAYNIVVFSVMDGMSEGKLTEAQMKRYSDLEQNDNFMK